jgi:hypothetical protein
MHPDDEKAPKLLLTPGQVALANALGERRTALQRQYRAAMEEITAAIKEFTRLCWHEGNMSPCPEGTTFVLKGTPTGTFLFPQIPPEAEPEGLPDDVNVSPKE